MVKSKSFIAIPPGTTIKEQIVDRNMSQKEFAVRMGISQKHTSRLINGEVQLTIEMARRLEMVLGAPAQFWCNLESIYREKLANINDEDMLDTDIEFAKKFPYNEMSKLGWVVETSEQRERVINLRKFFEVYQLNLIKDKLIPVEIECRKLDETEKRFYALVAWAQKAKLDGRNIETQPINVKALVRIIPDIRKMTIMLPSEFCPKLQSMLAECGIAISFLPNIGGISFHGATFYDGKKIILGITISGKDVNEFWFSLFHEIGHIILGHIDMKKGSTEKEEKEADSYSENVLIPDEDFDYFVSSNNLNESNIVEFARKESLNVEIVLGRLKKYGYVDSNSYSNLRKSCIIT